MFLIGAVMDDAAEITVGFPQPAINPASLVERKDEIVAMFLAALRVVMLARQA
jgi:hypothetical protein